MRRVLVRIGLLFAILFSAEAVVAIATSATLKAFQQWIGVTSVLVLGGAALAWSASPAPKLSDFNIRNYMVSSGTRRIWEPGRPFRFTLGPGAGLAAFGAGLSLGGAYLLMFLFQ